MRRDILTDLAEFGGRYDIGRLEGWGPWQEIKDRTGIRAQRSLRGQIEKLHPGKPHRASLLARSESRMTFSCHHSFKVCPLFGSVSPFTLCAIQGPVRGYQKMER